MENAENKPKVGRPPAKFPVKLLKRYRPIDGDRYGHPAGASIDLPKEEAVSLIERGLAVRNDPL